MKYKCNSCEHIFEGSSYSTKCPQCEHESIIPFKSSEGSSWFKKIIVWLKENKLISVVLILVLILILIPKQPEKKIIIPPPLPDTIYSLDFEERSNFCLVHLKNGDIKVPYSADIYSFLSLSATIIDDDGQIFIVPVSKNKITYCASGVVSISYKTDDNTRRMLNPKFTGSYDCSIQSLQSSGECLPKITLGNVVHMPAKCKVLVNVVQGASHAYISINGKEGDYQKSQSFDDDGIKQENFDIWYYPEGFDNNKMQFKAPAQLTRVLKSIKDNSSVASAPANGAKVLKDKLIKIIELVKQNKTSEADDAWGAIVGDISGIGDEFSIGGTELSLWNLTSEIQAHLGNNKTLKPLKNNIRVTIQNNGCASYYYEIKISL